MSDETRAAMEDAIRAHIADENDEPRVVTDWIALVAHEGADPGSTGYYYALRQGMAAHQTTGLLAHFLRYIERDEYEMEEEV